NAALADRARALFDAVVGDHPQAADVFFFPPDPFVPLKDVRDPARYHHQLLASYHRDILDLHRSRRSWNGAAFVSFDLGSRPTWVKAGDEWNKIGYWRSYRGKIRYEIAG